MRRVDAFVFVTGPDDDDGVEPDACVELEFASPLPLRPVLAGYIVGDFVEKSTRDSRERRHEWEFTDLSANTYKRFPSSLRSESSLSKSPPSVDVISYN